MKKNNNFVNRMKFRGVTCLFTEGRVDGEVHDDLKWYRFRHGDMGDWSVPVTLENNVVVNFWGDLFALEEIEINDDDLTEEEITTIVHAETIEGEVDFNDLEQVKELINDAN